MSLPLCSHLRILLPKVGVISVLKKTILWSNWRSLWGKHISDEWSPSRMNCKTMLACVVFRIHRREFWCEHVFLCLFVCVCMHACEHLYEKVPLFFRWDVLWSLVDYSLRTVRCNDDHTRRADVMVHYVGLAGGIRVCAVGTPICCFLANYVSDRRVYILDGVDSAQLCCSGPCRSLVLSFLCFWLYSVRVCYCCFAIVVLYGFFDCVLSFHVKSALFLSRYRSAVCSAQRMHPASSLSWFILHWVDDRYRWTRTSKRWSCTRLFSSFSCVRMSMLL